jgi:hypothetical protein
MATINPQIPTVGQPNSTEDAKITSGMTTIRDAINGNLDNDNIISGANINGSKLLDSSIATAKLAADAVTAAKLADLAVLSGNVNFVFQSNTGAEVAAGTTGVVLSSVASVVAGTYLVVGQCATNTAAHTLAIDSSGGAATITQPTSMFDTDHRITGAAGTAYVSGLQVARAVVTSTTTLRLTATRVSGTLVGSLYVFGVTAA